MLNQQPSNPVPQPDMFTVWMETLHTDLQYLQQSLRTLIQVVERSKAEHAPDYEERP